MNPSDYSVQEHIAELRRIAAQQRLAREALANHGGSQPNIVARSLNHLFALLRRPQVRRQLTPRVALNRPAFSAKANPCATLPELCIDEAWC